MLVLKMGNRIPHCAHFKRETDATTSQAMTTSITEHHTHIKSLDFDSRHSREKGSEVRTTDVFSFWMRFTILMSTQADCLHILVGGLEHFLFFIIFPYIGNVIIPTDFHSIIFQRGRLKVAQAPTRLHGEKMWNAKHVKRPADFSPPRCFDWCLQPRPRGGTVKPHITHNSVLGMKDGSV